MEVSDYKNKMSGVISKLGDELGMIRAGRANPNILDRVTVDYYGTPTPLKQMANISVPEARLLEIKPWDRSALKEIEKAILASDVNITPVNDGSVIRLKFPDLTEERRQDLVKEAKKVAENFKVNIRNIRREVIDEAKKEEKDKIITEDEVKAIEKQAQDLTDSNINIIDKMLEDKISDIMTI